MLLITCQLAETWHGVDVLEVQEIIRPAALTPVPQAPPAVAGILNLRGQIVTVLDLGRRFGAGPVAGGPSARIVVVRDGEESVGLLFDRVGDVITVSAGDRQPPPANLGPVQGRFFTGVIPTADGLVGVLDLAAVLTVPAAAGQEA